MGRIRNLLGRTIKTLIDHLIQMHLAETGADHHQEMKTSFMLRLQKHYKVLTKGLLMLLINCLIRSKKLCMYAKLLHFWLNIFVSCMRSIYIEQGLKISQTLKKYNILYPI